MQLKIVSEELRMCSSLYLSSAAIAVVAEGSANWKLGHPISRIRIRWPPTPRSRKPSNGVVCNYQQAVAELAPTTSTVYGLVLLSGGLYACKNHFPSFIIFLLKKKKKKKTNRQLHFLCSYQIWKQRITFRRAYRDCSHGSCKLLCFSRFSYHTSHD